MIPGYQNQSVLDGQGDLLFYRGIRNHDNMPVLIKGIRHSEKNEHIIRQLKSEFEATQNSVNGNVLTALEWLDTADHAYLVLKDPGGELLKGLIRSQVFETPVLLKIAVAIISALESLHKTNVLHLQLHPGNILIDPENESVWLTGVDFSRTGTTYELLDWQNSGIAFLNYFAPEQTGRMNRNVDYRSDFYAFGAIFYEMLAGEPPFVSDDPLELIHCHIAKTPLPPHAIDPKIPEILSSIVMKLLAKTAEERYQSIEGIRADLEKCYRQWQHSGLFHTFPIGQQDVSELFEIPKKLYGRQKEIGILLGAFERIHRSKNGSVELLLVSGYSGIGKTSLINAVQKPISRQKGYFISGKFDQYKRNIPYSAIIQAFQELVRQLLTESESQIRTWKDKLVSALGANGQVIVEVIPEIERIIGAQPPVPKLSPAEAQNRFNLVFERFIQVLTQKEHPMAIFLDDLQWADSGTLDLLRNVMVQSQIRYLLMIGAYRDNEVSETHPLIMTLTEIEKSGANVNNIILKPLEREHLNEFVADTVKRDISETTTLADLILKKTGGNPFFTTQFLKSLHEDGLILFVARERQKAALPVRWGWEWNIEDIEARDYTDNVVELMAGKIRRLAEETRQVLKLAACIGNRFDLQTLAIVNEASIKQTANHVQEALQEDLISPVSEFGFPETGGAARDLKTRALIFEFPHDRIQQAAYVLIPDDQKQAVHLKVGRLMLRNSTPEEREENLFDIVNHLNIAEGLIENAAEKLKLAGLNLEAGKKAKASTAFQQALSYFREGVKYLPDNCWQAHYLLSFDLYFERAYSKYLCGQFEDAELDFEMLLSKAQTNLERAEIYRLRIIQYENMSRFTEAVEWGKTGLRLLGIDLPAGKADMQSEIAAEHLEIKQKLADRSIAELIGLPAMSDPEKKISMKLLMTMWAPSYISGYGQLTVLISARMVNLSLEFGNCEESAFGYITHAIAVGPRQGDFAASYEYGRLALEINRTFDDLTARAKVNHMFSCYISFWRKHINTCFPYSKEAYYTGLESGDFIYAAYGAFHEAWHGLYRGEQLEQFDEAYRPTINFLSRNKFPSFIEAHTLTLNWGLSFRGLTESRTSLTNKEFDETTYIATYRNVPFFAAFYYIARAHIQYFFGEYKTALVTARKAEEVAEGVRGMIWEPVLGFLHPLIIAAAYPEANVQTQRKYWKELQVFKSQMQVWAENCRENFEHQYLLISAEMERIRGDVSSAIVNYEEAIRSAQNGGFLQNTALIQERYGLFWLERGNPAIGGLYLREALTSYRQWGATAKVSDLRERYPDLLKQPGYSQKSSVAITDLSDPAARHDPIDTVDFASAIKASQTLSGEIELPGLLEKLMRIMIENAGAQTGVLVLVSSGKFYIEAHGSADGDVKVLQSQPLEDSPDVPAGMVNYVKNTHESLVLNNAAEDRRFAGDPYLVKYQPKSVLCLPVLNHGKLTGILYLENNQTVDAFTDKHAAVLRVLVSQAAISLENARLYEYMKQEISERKRVEAALEKARDELEARVEERTRELENANRAKSVFLANMSHELRTPLNGILGYAQILSRDKKLNRAQKKGLGIIEQSGEHLLTLINDILDLSKIEAGMLEIQPLEIPLPAFLKSIIDVIEMRARQKGLSFRYQPVSRIPAVVKGDEKRLRQVLLNLLGNAVKFTDKGGIFLKVGYDEDFTARVKSSQKVSLSARRTKRRSHSPLRFQIEDTGIGIEADKLEEIFLPFQQIPQRRQHVEGTGLGLSISHQLVNLMDGELHVESTFGEGSVFYVILDLPVDPAYEDARESSHKTKAALRQVNGFKGNPKKILVVDDKLENRSVLQNLLSPLGFQIENAANGREALKKAALFKPHAILMDLVMPVMDGFESTRRIRQSAKLKDIVVIALSASVFDHNRSQSAEAGCNDFIPKPVRAETLLAKLQHYLGLEWTYDSEKPPGKSAGISRAGRPGEALIAPPVKEMEKLYQLAQSGDIQSILNELDDIQNLSDTYMQFVEELRTLANKYQMKRVREFIKQHLA